MAILREVLSGYREYGDFTTLNLVINCQRIRKSKENTVDPYTNKTQIAYDS